MVGTLLAFIQMGSIFHEPNIGPESTRWWENPIGMLEVSERLSAARLIPARPTSHLFVHPPWFEDCALHIPATP